MNKLKIIRPKFKFKEWPSGVYRITFDGKYFYIGSSPNVRNRISQWVTRLQNGIYKNRNIAKVAPSASVISFEVLERTPPNDVLGREDFYIKANWGNPYFLNLCPSAFCNSGLKLSEDQSLAISARNRNISIEEAKSIIQLEEMERIKRATPVACFDDRGNFLYKYESVKEASDALNISTRKIRSYLSGEKLLPIRGLSFSKINEDGNITPPIIRIHPSKLLGIKIAQYDTKGNIIKVFDSQRELLKALKIDSRNFRRVLTGEYKQWKGSVFKYA
jgi:hypothetical protein